MAEGHLDGVAAGNTAIAFRGDKIVCQSLAYHPVTNQDFHCRIEIGFQQTQGMKVRNVDSTGFFQEHLKAGLPAREGVTMIECNFGNQSMELSNLGAVNTCLVMAIVEPRIGGRGLFAGASPMPYKIIMANTGGDWSEPWRDLYDND